MLQRMCVIKHVLLYHQIVCVTGYRFNSIYNNMYMFLQPLHVIFVQLLINPYHNAIIVSRLFYTYKLYSSKEISALRVWRTDYTALVLQF